MSLSVLQLRRFLRAIGQPTAGLKPVLTARLEKAQSNGTLKAYVDGARKQPREAVECGEFLRSLFATFATTAAQYVSERI